MRTREHRHDRPRLAVRRRRYDPRCVVGYQLDLMVFFCVCESGPVVNDLDPLRMVAGMTVITLSLSFGTVDGHVSFEVF